VNADFYGLKRTYFPNVNLSQFTSNEKQLIEKDIETEFAEALKGIRQLPASSRSGVYLAYIYYRELFNKIKKATAENVMAGRIRISNGQKFGLMCDSLIRYKMNAI
jgi:phytoene/squalene synthetase